MKKLITLIAWALFCYFGNAQDLSVQTTIPEQSADEDNLYELNIDLNKVFKSQSNDELTFLFTLPDNSCFLALGDTLIRGIPLAQHVGKHTIEIEASNTNNESISTSFSIVVNAVNDAPVVVKPLPAQGQMEGFGSIELPYLDVFIDEEDTNLNYSISSSNTNVISVELKNERIVVTETGNGTASIELRAEDSKGLATLSSAPFKVYTSNDILSFTTQNTGSSQIANSKITFVKADKKNNIWATSEHEFSYITKEGITQKVFDAMIGDLKEIWEDKNGHTYFISRSSIIKYNGTTYDINHRDSNPVLPDYSHAATTYLDSVLYLLGTDNELKTRKLIKNNGEGWELVTEETFEQPIDNMNCLSVDYKEKLWIGTNSGVLTYDGTQWTDVSSELNISEPVYQIYCYNDDVWIATSNRVIRYNANSTSTYTIDWANCITSDFSGNILIGGLSGYINIIARDGSQTTIRLEPPIEENKLSQGNKVYSICTSRTGEIIIGCQFGLYKSTNYEVSNESMEIIHTFDGLPSNDVESILKDNNDSYWFNTASGLTVFDGSEWNYVSESGHIYFIDKNNNKWLSENNSVKVIKNDEQVIYYNSTSTGLSQIFDMAEGINGQYWVAGSEGLAKFDGNTWTLYTTSDGLLNNQVFKIFADSQGNVWIEYANWDEGVSIGISRFDGTNMWHYDTNDGLCHNTVNDITEDNNGIIWLATSGGLNKFDNDLWYSYNTPDLKQDYIQNLTADKEGIWIVYDWNISQGVSYFDYSQFYHYTTNEGLPTNKIKAVYADKLLSPSGSNQLKATSSSDIWLGSSDSGIARFNISSISNDISELKKDEIEFSIYPNPARDYLIITSEQLHSRYINIQLYNISGQVVYSEKRFFNSTEQRINFPGLNEGIYLLEISDNKKTAVKKVIIQ